MGEAIKIVSEHEISVRRINERLVCRVCGGPVRVDGQAEIHHAQRTPRRPWQRTVKPMSRQQLEQMKRRAMSRLGAAGLGLGSIEETP